LHHAHLRLPAVEDERGVDERVRVRLWLDGDLRVQGLGVGVQDLGSRVEGLGFRVHHPAPV